jgi:hypothetical protein
MNAASLFYWPVVMWVEYPVLAFVPVMAFAAALAHFRRVRRARRRLLLVTAIWLVYAGYEVVMFVWARQVIAPIRIDLIVLGPAMYAVTGFGAWTWWWAARAA